MRDCWCGVGQLRASDANEGSELHIVKVFLDHELKMNKNERDAVGSNDIGKVMLACANDSIMYYTIT